MPATRSQPAATLPARATPKLKVTRRPNTTTASAELLIVLGRLPDSSRTRGYDVSVAGKRLGIIDPSGRLIEDLAAAAETADVVLKPITIGESTHGLGAILVPPAIADDMQP